jgi:hypothetical protein
LCDCPETDCTWPGTLNEYTCNWETCRSNSDCRGNYCCEAVIRKRVNNDDDMEDCVYIDSVSEDDRWLCYG